MGTIFIGKISKGRNSVRSDGGNTVLILCTSSDGALYLNKFHENILDGIKVIEHTRFSWEKFQRGIIL